MIPPVATVKTFAVSADKGFFASGSGTPTLPSSEVIGKDSPVLVFILTKPWSVFLTVKEGSFGPGTPTLPPSCPVIGKDSPDCELILTNP